MESNFEKNLEREEKEEINEYKKLYDLIVNTDIAPTEEDKNWSLDKIEEQLEQSFKLTGQEALEINQGTIYTTLSGGLDSTLAISLLRKNFPEARIVTFTMGGDEEHPDIKFARQASEKFDTQHIEIIPDKNEIEETLDEYKKKFPEDNLEEAVKTGNFDVYLLFKNIIRQQPKILLSYEGIDELMGGYWVHRKENSVEEKRKIFNDYWQRLKPEHLMPTIRTTESFDVKLLFPYLNEKLIKSIAEIPVNERASEGVGKKPLRDIATRLGVPKEIIERTKRGQVGMTEIEELRSKIKSY